MQSSVLAATAGCMRNAMALRDPCDLTVSSGASDVLAQKRSGRPRKSWDEELENDRKNRDMDSADPQNRSVWRGRL